MLKAKCIQCNCSWYIDTDFAYLSEQDWEYINIEGHFRTLCEDCDPDTQYEFVV